MVASQNRTSSRTSSKRIVAILLGLVAGFVDVVGYIALYRLFTAHMTGVTVHLGMDLVTRNWPAILIVLLVVISFLGGSIAGRLAIESGARAGLRRIASINLSAEAVVLLGGIYLPSSQHALGLGLLGLAMGLQSSTITRIGNNTVHTTFVTGMLNTLSQLVAQIAFYTRDLRVSTQDADRLRRLRAQKFDHALFVLAIWMAYLAGAVCGTGLSFRVGIRALFAPLVVLALAVAADQLRPLSIEEERQQAEIHP